MSLLSGGVRTSLTDFLRVVYRPDDARMHVPSAKWIPRGHVPTTRAAEERVLHLREFGPTPHSFTLRDFFPPPDVVSSGPLHGPEEWTCPA
jgi:hypothetical protein